MGGRSKGHGFRLPRGDRINYRVTAHTGTEALDLLDSFPLSKIEAARGEPFYVGRSIYRGRTYAQGGFSIYDAGGRESGVFLVNEDQTVKAAQLKEVTIETLLASLLVLAVAFFISRLLSRTLSLPLQELATMAEEFGKGRLSKKVEVTGDDEVGLLAQAFMDTGEKLKNSYTSLEKKVAERTFEYEKEEQRLEEMVMERTKELHRAKEAKEIRSRELEERILEVEAINRAFVGREVRMRELKRELKEYKEKSGVSQEPSR